MSLDVGDIVMTGGVDFLTYGDLYSIRVAVIPPDTLGQWNSPPVCKDSPPFEWDNEGPFVTTTLDGTLVKPTTGEAVPSSLTSTGPGAHLDTVLRGLLVNPAPTWPTPDAEGNTFGSVLWAPSDFPTITATIEIVRGPRVATVNPGRLTAFLWPFVEGEAPDPGDAQFQCLVGCG